jgi:hypothetical protein
MNPDLECGRQSLAADLKRQFVLISECEIEEKADLYFEQIERRGESVRVLVVDFFDFAIASKLWDQRAYLVSAARQVGLSRFCLIKCCGERFGLAMMGREYYPPSPLCDNQCCWQHLCRKQNTLPMP